MKLPSEFINENVKLSETVDKFWNLESLGISPTEASIYETFTADIKFKDQRYQVKLPFEEHHDDLKDHYNIAKARLKGQFHKFKNNKKLLLECDTILKEQESLSIIEKITGDDDGPGHTRNYLPNRPVVRGDTVTTKVRILFDARAKQNGVSLNDCLYTGTSLSATLFGILLRFRSHNIAFTSDIEKAFLQIAIDPNDRDYLRFLWFSDTKNIDYTNFGNNALAEYRLCRVLFGATCSSFLLTGTLISHFNQYTEEPEFVKKSFRITAGRRPDFWKLNSIRRHIIL